MSMMNELRAALGPDLGASATADRNPSRWIAVCVCGHLSMAHAPRIGGDYQVRPTVETSVGGRPIREVKAVTGCVGAMPSKYFERFTDTTETVGDTVIRTQTANATCPCDEFRPVLNVDRPHRYFNQRMPTAAADRRDYTKHPMMVALRAYRTRIGKLKRAQVSDVGAVWADEEFDRRVTWIDGKRICSISGCRETADVWPVYTSDADDRSELRCPKHR